MSRPPRVDSESLGALWPVGQVAAALGIPAVTLRSWERRYQIGPSHRSAGDHRRYTRADVDHLQRMRNLIAAGIPARVAATLSVGTTDDAAQGAEEIWEDHDAGYLLDLASTSRLQSLADELDSCLNHRGISSAWEQVISPALRMLNARYLTTADCVDIELVLTQAVSEAVDRHNELLRPRAGDIPHPVLLMCCPGEQHHLPLKVLQGALLHQAIPTVFLGPGLPPEASAAAINRIAPSVVVLWALTRRRDLTGFHRFVAQSGFVTCAAGPGWPHTRDPATTLDSAVSRISGLWLLATSAAGDSPDRSQKFRQTLGSLARQV